MPKHEPCIVIDRNGRSSRSGGAWLIVLCYNLASRLRLGGSSDIPRRVVVALATDTIRPISSAERAAYSGARVSE